MSELTSQQKRKQLLAMLRSGMVMIHLDPRVEGVVVPPQFAGDDVLRLNLDYRFNLPALDIGKEGIYAVLSFNRVNFGCTLPWASIFAMTAPHDGHQGMVWPCSVPPEMQPYFADAGLAGSAVPVVLRAVSPRSEPDEAPEAAPHAAPEPAVAEAAAGRRRFAVHDGGGEGATGEEAAAEGGEAKPRRPVLTVVK